MAEDSFHSYMKSAWRSIERVNDRYSEGEIKDLVSRLRIRGNNNFDLNYRWHLSGGIRLTGLRMTPEACECFSDSLENMPLYINHPKEEVQVVAAWRLLCAK
jgi:hypothetical protein